MNTRDDLTRSFLETTRWTDAHREQIAGDASNRRYERLTDAESGETVILMDAPPDRGEDVRPFVKIARYLESVGLSAPNIVSQDIEHGFLLIEDLGDALFARVLRDQPDLEDLLYSSAIDVLLDLHRAPVPNLEHYGPETMVGLACLAFSKYRDGITGDTAGEIEFRTAFKRLLAQIEPDQPVLIQRDYHAENLLWLPHRKGVTRVGLLDFQDAMTGHPAYDLVSLLQDARRDVPARIETTMIARYLASSDLDPDSFRTAYYILGVQRNLRILGVFARLGLDYGKPDYVDLIPRVWSHLMRDLEHPSLSAVSGLLKKSLPEPSPENLQKLKSA